MIDLRCFDIREAGSCWIVRCKRCDAGWLPSKEGYDPEPMIEHAMKHQVRMTRAEQVQRQIAAAAAAMEAVEFELTHGPEPASEERRKLMREFETFRSWKRFLEQTLAEVLATPDRPATERSLDAGRTGENAWLANRSYLTQPRI